MGVGMAWDAMARPTGLQGDRCRLLRWITVGSGLGLVGLLAPPGRTNGAVQGSPGRPAPPASSVVANLAPASFSGGAEPSRCPTTTLAQGRRTVAGARLRYPLTRWAGEISPYGWRYSSARGAWRMHSGIDLITPPGTPVLAVMGGQVARVDTISGYGLAVIVDHGNGWQSLYAHLQAVAVRPCTVIPAGGQLGWVGHSGSASTDHLHLELRSGAGPSQVAVDPAAYLPRP
jgi:murein DD-endopeptidase MepM/ murein hydrolase activator NlpD